MTNEPTQPMNEGHPTSAQTTQIPVMNTAAPSIPPTVPPSVQPVASQEPEPSKKKHRGIIIAIIVAVALIAAAIGVAVYHTKHNEAYEACQAAVQDFSTTRKSVLDTSDNSGVLTGLVRNAFGVDDILDAFAKASTSAEQTVSSEGCSSHATIIQLNLVADTLNSATASLKESLKSMESQVEDKITGGSTDSNTSDSSDSSSDSSSSSSDSSDSSSSDSSIDQELDEAKKDLEQSIDNAEDLLDKAKESVEDGTVGKALSDTLDKAMDSAKQMLEDSGITDSKYFKAAQATIDEAINAIQSWVNAQAAKVQ